MKLSEFKNQLNTTHAVNFLLPDGSTVPNHFHITEAGLVTKNFVDCGGTIRKENSINFQVWVATDTQHRLEPQKLLKIISTYEKLFGTEDLEVEIEYQTNTIGKYGLAVSGNNFLFTAKQTNCLASSTCGSPKEKQTLPVEELQPASSCCAPGGGCC